MATKIENSSPKVQEFQFRSTPKTTKWEDFQRSVYDRDKKEIFGRTRKSWYQLLLFYTIFYACLAALFSICMKGLIATLNDNEPTYQLENSLIGTNPGLGFRPISQETEQGSLIWYNVNNSESNQKWVDSIDEFLLPYKVDQIGKNYQSCDYNMSIKEGNVCTVNVSDFGPCTSENSYGYKSTSPCVFLKLNRIFGWVPDVYTKGVEEMSADLKDIVENATNENKTEVWISCEGENPFDKESVEDFRYFPTQGFPGYYFPYKNYANYLSPLIAVQTVNVKPHTIVNIECRAWAKNIIYSGSEKNREGSVHFEILVD